MVLHKIIWNNSILSGDKAVVIALAERRLSHAQQKKAALFGSGAAMALRIPLVVFGSTLMIRLMERFPVIVTLGAALTGWVGGETMASDSAIAPLLHSQAWLHQIAPALGAALVIGLGRWLQHHEKNKS